MNYRPDTVSDSVISGRARVVRAKSSKTDKTAWRLTVQVYDKTAKTFVQWPNPVNIDPKNAPSYLSPGDWVVRMTSDKTKILSAVPDSATATAEFVDIAHQEGKPYTPKVVASGYDASKPWIQFGLIYRIVEGPYEGVEVQDWVNYNFGKAPKTYKGEPVVAYYPGGKKTEELAARMEALGVWDFGPIKWDGPDILFGDQKVGVNILNVIARRCRKAVEETGRKVLITLAAGRVVSIKEALSDDVLMDEDDDAAETDGFEDTDTAATDTNTDASDDGLITDDAPGDDDEIEWGDE